MLPKFSGLGIPIFSESTEREYKFSIMLPREWTTKILNELNRVQGVLSWLTTILGGDIWLEKSVILRPNSNQVCLSTNKIAILLRMWNKIWFRECLSFPYKKEGFVSPRHNHVKMSPIGATLLNEFWKNVWVERQLQ